MHTGKRYRLLELLAWTRRETLAMTVIAVVPIVVSAAFGWRWLEIPWVPIAMLGTASAFTVGFRNNATYARTWEARQIWGGIVNASRAWGLMARDLVGTGREAGGTAAGAGGDDDVTRVLHNLETVEPLLRRAAGHEIDTSARLDDVVAALLGIVQSQH